MTAEEITELFVSAAEIDRRLPNTARPAMVKSMSLPYVADWADMLGWGAERLDEERKDFWDNIGRRLNPADVTLWEKANDMIRLVQNQGQRRALLHWSVAKAGGRSFAKWCRSVEGIHEETGRRRKDRAVLAIISAYSCVNGVSTHDYAFESLLPNLGEISHIPVNITEPRREFKWAADGAIPLMCDFDRSLTEFSWAAEQNERRRQRDAKRKREAA